GGEGPTARQVEPASGAGERAAVVSEQRQPVDRGPSEGRHHVAVHRGVAPARVVRSGDRVRPRPSGRPGVTGSWCGPLRARGPCAPYWTTWQGPRQLATFSMRQRLRSGWGKLCRLGKGCGAGGREGCAMGTVSAVRTTFASRSFTALARWPRHPGCRRPALPPPAPPPRVTPAQAAQPGSGPAFRVLAFT